MLAQNLAGKALRVDNPRQLMAYLGLVPSERSSGVTTRRGGITKAGNALASLLKKPVAAELCA